MSAEPCQFGLLGVLDVTPSTEQSQLLQPCDGVESSAVALERDALSNGLLTAFAWTSAMAYNQGRLRLVYHLCVSQFTVHEFRDHLSPRSKWHTTGIECK